MGFGVAGLWCFVVMFFFMFIASSLSWVSRGGQCFG
jgi:hypothetical protein